MRRALTPISDKINYLNKQPECMMFDPLYRGSDMMTAKTWLARGDFHHDYEDNAHTIKFIDTYNYCKMSVEKMGKILGIEKLEKPSCLGRRPKDDAEFRQMHQYNMRDAQISKMYLKFIFDSVHELGATPKETISQTAMSLFKNKYLKDEYYRQTVDDMDEIFLAYYGGRVEAFKRGRLRDKDYHYYDFNSLYPSVMLGWFPDPNSHRVTFKDTAKYIMNYEGVSLVDVECPDMKIPLLPFRTKDKLVFPTGTFQAWQTHVELRKALSIGYVIKKVHKTHYYKKLCQPFKEYVTDLYEKRKQLKSQGSPMELVVKLLMNSLYGKFGQKYRNRDNIEPFIHNKEQLEAMKKWEPFGNDYIRVIKEFTEPSAFIVPIWAAYVTAYGRLKLYNSLVDCEPIYCDTDSIITEKAFPTSKELGDLKLEMDIKEGYIVRAKFYAVLDREDNEYVKIKGVGRRLCFDEFDNFIDDPEVKYEKFMKFREAVRRGKVPNEIIEVTKRLTLEDDKRLWTDAFTKEGLQVSCPLLMINGVESRKYRKLQEKALEAYREQLHREKMIICHSDVFDLKSKGCDISDEEFFDNETSIDTD